MINRLDNPGKDRFSSAKALGECLKNTLEQDPHFYLFSPDETTSNRLDATFAVSPRAWGDLPIKPWDLPESPAGRQIELLSENTLFATMIGHLSNNEPAMMTSYECFFPIVTSQILQQLKFITQSEQVPWRKPLPAVNLLSTSTCWRQDHNGFTHQSPALISTLLSLPNQHSNCLFPVDDIAAEAAYDFMLASKNVVNLTTFNKTEEPRWIDSNHAKFQLENGGASIFQFASDDNPDLIFTAAGDLATRETLYAIKILKSDLPGLKVRFVGLAALCYNHIGTTNNPLKQQTFDDYFTKDKPIIANFHGYPATLQQILARYTNQNRIATHGFSDQGSTTTPFEMLSLNRASRYDLATTAANLKNRPDLAEKYQNTIKNNHNHALDFGEDLPEITNFTW